MQRKSFITLATAPLEEDRDSLLKGKDQYG
jgi:hypothetical protein